MKTELTYGIELECVFNAGRAGIDPDDVRGYHEGGRLDFLPGWKIERDSSIRQDNEFGDETTCAEFISYASPSKKSFLKRIKVFKDFMSKNGKQELHQVLVFNQSTGAHIHFGRKDNKQFFSQKVPFETIGRTRNKFYAMMKRSNITSKDFIIDHYIRDYAKKLIKTNNCFTAWKFQYGKYSEFNFHSERSSKGLEWRGPNLLGIRTWSEFDEAIEIYLECIDYLVRATNKFRYEGEVKLTRDEAIVIAESKGYNDIEYARTHLKVIIDPIINPVKAIANRVDYTSRRREIELQRFRELELNTHEDHHICDNCDSCIDCGNCDCNYESDEEAD